MSKKKLNLLAIAKQTEQDFEEVELTINGETYTERVYRVPNPVIWSFKPSRPEPELPTRLMRPDVGGRQQRVALRRGDEGWNEYQADLADYENEAEAIQSAARYVLALADVEYPDLSQPPPLATKNGVVYPANEMLRKKIWLDYTLFLNQANLIAVQAAMTKQLTGSIVTPDQVDGIKKNSGSDTEGGRSGK